MIEPYPILPKLAEKNAKKLQEILNDSKDQKHNIFFDVKVLRES